MRHFSHEARLVVERLYDAVNARTRLFQSPVDPSPLVAEVAAAGGLAAVPYMAPLLLDRREPVVAAAATAITALMHATGPRDLAWLDQQMRVHSPYYHFQWQTWIKMAPGQLVVLTRSDGTATTLHGLASFHPSGYVREAAVEQLAATWEGSELPFLLLRVNDWVAAVRKRARRATEQRLVPDYAKRFVARLPLVLRLTESGREPHGAVVEAVYALLRRPEAQEALGLGMTATDRWTGRACFQIATEGEGPGLPAVVDFGLQAEDLLIRQSAARSVAAAFDGEELRGRLTRMRGDCAAGVRRAALAITLEREPAEAEGRLLQALLDPHPAMRGDARRALASRGVTDVAPYYREALRTAAGADRISALAGLGETGRPEDATLALACWGDPRIRVRRSVVRCIARLSAGQENTFLLEALHDAAPGVSREAREALAPRIYAVGAARLWSLFQEDAPRHTRVALLALLAAGWKWEACIYLIRAVSDRDPEVAARAEWHLDRWIADYNRSHTEPTRDQLAEMASALDGAEASLAPEKRDTLRQYYRLGEEMVNRSRHSPRR